MRKILVFTLFCLLLLIFISDGVYAERINDNKIASQPDVVKNQLLIESAKIADMGMETARDMLLLAFYENITEADVVRAIEDSMTENGSSEDVEAFGVIVASGDQSAIPHGDESDDATNQILPGEAVVVDLGARYMGFCSDLTRTFFMGNASSEMMEVYNITLEAQMAGIEAVRAGVWASDVDKVSRDIIASYGYGENFIHALGHGIGLYIHMPPTLSPSSNEVLFESGDMTVTIEPGIYLEGNFGVRIEDDVVVERGGNTVITHYPKDLNSSILLPEDYMNETKDAGSEDEDQDEGGIILLGLGVLIILIAVGYIYLRQRRKKQIEANG
jgi:Xaa-Pro aminopeptidase